MAKGDAEAEGEFDPTAPPAIPAVSGSEGPLWAEDDDGNAIPQYALSDIQGIPLIIDEARTFPSQFVEPGDPPRDYVVVKFRFAKAKKGPGIGITATTRTGSAQVVELLAQAELPVTGKFVTKTSRAGREYAALVPPDAEEA